jgi:hypothetical protein
MPYLLRSVLLILLTSIPALADDRSDAIDLLKLAFECPTEPIFVDEFTKEIRRARYVGDARSLGVKIEKESVILGTGEHYQELTVNHLIMPFSSVSEVSLNSNVLTLICANNRKCIRDNVVANPDSEFSCDNDFCEPGMKQETKRRLAKTNIRFCSPSMAENAMAAVKVLAGID